jgi:hypothetical protein
MSELPSDYKGQDLSRMQKLQMGMRNLKGVDSAYKDYRTYGKLGEWAKTGYGAIPWLAQGVGALANTLGLKRTGDKSYGQRWAVDNAGFGQGTQRDQFGLYVGTGLGGSVQKRMQAKVDDILARGLHKNNSTVAAQLKDYQEKLGIIKSDEQVAGAVQKNIKDKRARDYLINERIRKQGVYARHKDEPVIGRDTPDTPKDTPPKHPPSTWTPAGQTGPDTPSVTPESMGMSTVGGGDPFYKKGGRAGFFYGGIATAL